MLTEFFPRVAFVASLPLLALLADSTRAAQTPLSNGCQPTWLPSSGGQTNVTGNVADLVTFDDGTGPALYAAGHAFTIAGSSETPLLMKWDGVAWSSVPGGPQGTWALSLAVHDDGSGPALFVGGSFTSAGGAPTNGIARWDGSSWSDLAGGIDGEGVVFASVQALCEFDEGAGPKLFAGGRFVSAGGAVTGGLARWDGSSWTAVGPGITNDLVTALEVFDDGDGPALYVAGSFQVVGADPLIQSRITRWDGAAWDTSIDAGLGGTHVAAFEVFDDGSGPALYAGGLIFLPGLGLENQVIRWDGAAWSPVGNGLGVPFDSVGSLQAFDDGRGPALFAGGNFSVAGGSTPVKSIARWAGSAWEPVAGGLATAVFALVVHDDGTGDALYAGGNLLSSPAGGTPLAKWGGCPPSTAVTAYGSGLNPAGSLVVLQGTTQLGGSITFGVSNPLTSTSSPAFAALAVSVAPAPGFPGGVVLPGLGLASPFASGESLVDLAAPNVVLGPVVWPGGTSAPAAFALGLPAAPSLAGLALFAQGLLVGAPDEYGIGLTNGLTFALGL